MEVKQHNSPESSAGVDGSAVSKIIWGLPFPNAEKNFMWRACHNLLPTKDNLLRRWVVDDPFCPICTLEEKTIFHIVSFNYWLNVRKAK
jgi:hypothetical protein